MQLLMFTLLQKFIPHQRNSIKPFRLLTNTLFAMSSSSNQLKILFSQISSIVDRSADQHDTNLYKKLNDFGEAQIYPTDNSSVFEWDKIVRYIEAHPPRNMMEARGCLFWSNKQKIALNIDKPLSTLDYAAAEWHELISVYYFVGYSMLTLSWDNVKNELIKRLEKMSDNSQLIKADDLNTMLDLRYHHLRSANLKYIDSKIPRLIFQSLKDVLFKYKELQPERLSYMVMYACSMEYEVMLIGDKAKEIFKLIHGIAADAKKRISQMSHREISNYVLASTFINTGSRLNIVVQEIQRKMLEVGLQNNHVELYRKLMTFQFRTHTSQNRSLFGSQVIKKMCSLIANNLNNQPINKTDLLLRMFKHYGNLLKDTDVPKIMKNIVQDMYKLNNSIFLSGLQYAVINGFDIKDTFFSIISTNASQQEHKETRLTLIASEMSRSTFLNFIQNREKVLREKAEYTTYKIGHALKQTLFQNTEEYCKISNILLDLILSFKIKERLGDSQLFRMLMYITVGDANIKRVVEWLIKRKIQETPELRKRLIAMLLRVFQNQIFDSHKMKFIHGALTGLKIQSNEYCTYLVQNRRLICSFMTNSDKTKQMFYSLLDSNCKLHDLTKLYVIITALKFDDGEPIKKIIMSHKDFGRYRNIFQLIITNNSR